VHRDHPYEFQVGGHDYKVVYEPAESTSSMFGGNSNWRGPVWFPINILVIRALLDLYQYFGDDFTVECPTGSGRSMTLFEVARELSSRLVAIFRNDQYGHRPVFGQLSRFRTILTGTIVCCSTSTSMVTMARGSAQAIKRDGQGLSHAWWICWANYGRKMS
jgi:hypothetical protein